MVEHTEDKNHGRHTHGTRGSRPERKRHRLALWTCAHFRKRKLGGAAVASPGGMGRPHGQVHRKDKYARIRAGLLPVCSDARKVHRWP